MKKLLRSNSKKKPSDSTEQEDQKDSNARELEGLAKYSNIIYLIIGSVAVCFLAGYLLDKLFHTSFLEVVFSFGGVILALYLVFKELNRK